jgi:hypothetical protein
MSWSESMKSSWVPLFSPMYLQCPPPMRLCLDCFSSTVRVWCHSAVSASLPLQLCCVNISTRKPFPRSPSHRNSSESSVPVAAVLSQGMAQRLSGIWLAWTSAKEARRGHQSGFSSGAVASRSGLHRPFFIYDSRCSSILHLYLFHGTSYTNATNPRNSSESRSRKVTPLRQR